MLNRKTALAAAMVFLFLLSMAAVPAYADKIYAALTTGEGVAVIDPALLDAWGEIKTGPSPAYLAKAGGLVFETESVGGRVGVLDPASDELVDTLDVGEQPFHIEAAPDGGTVVVGSLPGRVSVIEVAGLRVLKSIEAPGEVYTLKISPDGSKAYAGGKEGRLWVIDLKKAEVTNDLPIPQSVYQTTLTASGDRLIVNSLEDSEVTIFTLPGMKVLKKLAAGSQGLALSPDESELWYGGPEGSIRVYSFKQDKVVAEMPRDSDANLDMIFSPDGSRVYASPAGPGSDEIYVYDTAARVKTGAIKLKESPRGLLYIKE